MCSAAFSCGRSSRLFQMRTDISCCVRTSAKNWQTQPLQGASVAVVTLLHLWCMSAGKIVVHLVGHLLGLLPQLWGQVNPFATPCRCVQKDVLWNIADKHLFQSHSLCAKLQPICIARFRETVLIFHRQRQPAPGIFLKRPPSGSEWNSTTSQLPDKPQAMSYHLQSPHRQQISALFVERVIMITCMQQIPRRCMQILSPLLLHIGRRSLAPAEAKVLNTRYLQIIVRIHHRLRLPSRAARRR